MSSFENVVLVLVVLILASIVGVYSVVVRNRLATHWSRLLSLAANVRTARQRRQGVAQDLGRHVAHAQRHEGDVTRSGARRSPASARQARCSTR